MFQLNEDFLVNLGLDGLPNDQKQAFLDHIYSELELRVGVRLSNGMSDAQLNEFESFVDRNDQKVREWITANAPDYSNDRLYAEIYHTSPSGSDEMTILARYASLKWLAINRPNYQDIVAQVLEELKREIASNRDSILHGHSGGVAS